MKRNFAMLAAAVSFAALPTFAFAADAIDEIPAAPEAPACEQPVAGNWAGAYAGVYAGHGWAKHGGVESKGFNGGAFGGYNMQTDSIVYGAEADAGYSASDGTAAGTTQDIRRGSFVVRSSYGEPISLCFWKTGAPTTQKNTRLGLTFG